MSGIGADATPRAQTSEIRRVFGPQISELIRRVAQPAKDSGLKLFLVGGFVRDLWLGQRSFDLDFVLEGDAIDFAEALAGLYGGAIQIHAPFGTAKWTLDEAVAESLSLALDQIPSHVDFTTARKEIYAYPSALPAVAPGEIRQDLLRRDFTINALALQLSPRICAGEVIDVAGGVNDLDKGLIRVLQEQSFVDDPTRVIRAHRYAQRYGFEVEAQTAAWMREALPILGRLTGQRLRNEIDLILREPEAGQILLRLQELGALHHIHLAFVVSARLPELLARCTSARPPWSADDADGQTLRWSALLASVDPTDARDICERLALTKALTNAIVASAHLAARIGILNDPNLSPSQITRMLDKLPDAALEVGWLLAAEKSQAMANLTAYASDWRHRRATISGADLKAMGIEPGPLYRRLLEQLRFAWIEKEIQSVRDEEALLHELLAAEGCAPADPDWRRLRERDSS
ncbi:MAG: hypothetical protein OXG85_13795 [Chloroflexi bacterium]|nr:hypothetical protein [Chloroflexota bacterium]